jgi:hypothetical protein
MAMAMFVTLYPEQHLERQAIASATGTGSNGVVMIVDRGTVPVVIAYNIVT